MVVGRKSMYEKVLGSIVICVACFGIKMQTEFIKHSWSDDQVQRMAN